MALEHDEALRYSAGLLKATAALVAIVPNVYESQVPQGSTFHVLGDVMGGGDVQGVGGTVLLSNPLLLWRVVQKGQISDPQRNAAQLMHAALHGVRAVISNGWVITITRNLNPSTHRRVFYDGANNAWTETGGYYRYSISPA